MDTDDKSYPKLDAILIDVHKKKIKLDDDDRKFALNLLHLVKTYIDDKFKECDSVLKFITNGTTYNGSYFDGVKVGAPNEFDIDIQLKLPSFKNELVKFCSTEPGYISINIKEAFAECEKNPTWKNKYGKLSDFMDDKGYLLSSKILRELEKVFHTIGTSNFPLRLAPDLEVMATIRKQGPAFNFELIHNGTIINIDFVFVLWFPSSKWPPKPFKKYLIPRGNSFWFAVPKRVENPRSWRVSFPNHEKDLIGGYHNLKIIYRLLKLMRDALKWNIASYYIKTLFLWKNIKLGNEADQYWKKSVGTLFMAMLNELKIAVTSGEILFFWDPRCNLIEGNKSNINIGGKLERMIRDISSKYDDKELLSDYVFNKIFFITNGEPKTRLHLCENITEEQINPTTIQKSICSLS